jgi:peptidoglycan biosynthesis protein MviN/MurJ (putative lipid II flippase)
MTTSSPVSAAQTLLRGAGLAALFAVATALARLGLDAAMAWRHGVGAELDAYLFLANLVNWPAAVVLSCLTLLVSPLEAQLRQEGPQALARFRAELLGWSLLVAGVALPLAGAGLLVAAGGSLAGFGAATAAIAREGAWPLAPALPLALLVALASAWMVAAGRHVLTLTEAVPPLLLALLILLLPPPVLFWGTTAALAAQLLLLLVLLGREGMLPRPRWSWHSPAWRRLDLGALGLVVAQVLFTTMPLIDQFFASRLQEGTLAALGFANRLVLGLQGVAGLALQRAALPLLARLDAQRRGRAAELALRWALVAAAVAAALAGLAALAAGPVVTLLYQRGEFTAEHRDSVVELLRWGLLQFPPYVAGVLLMTAVAAGQRHGDIARAALAGLLVKIGASLLLVPSHGAVGLQLATALTYLSTAAWLAVVILRRPRVGGPLPKPEP